MAGSQGAILKDASIFSSVATAMENKLRKRKSTNAPKGLRKLHDSLRDKAIECTIWYKVNHSKVGASDLLKSTNPQTERVLNAAEKYLARLYPDINLNIDPGRQMLYGAWSDETVTVVQDLIDHAQNPVLFSRQSDTASSSGKDDPVSAAELEDPKQLAELEEELATLYNLDLSTDLATDLLEGRWQEETQHLIDELLSSSSS